MLHVLQGKAIAERTFPNLPLRAHCFPSTTSISKQIGTTPLVERQHFHPSKTLRREEETGYIELIPVRREEEEGYIENNEIRWNTPSAKGKRAIY